MSAFVDGRTEMIALLEVFRDLVRAGTVRPGLDDDVVVLGLDDHATHFIELRRMKSGALWVAMLAADGRVIEEWGARELDAKLVGDLWTECRNRLYTSRFEEGVAGLTEWLRRHQAP